MNRLVHRSHADESLKQDGLRELPPNRDGQMLIQCRNGTSAIFFGFQMAILTAGRPLPLGERHEEAPATFIDLSLLSWFPGSAKSIPVRKLANY